MRELILEKELRGILGVFAIGACVHDHSAMVGFHALDELFQDDDSRLLRRELLSPGVATTESDDKRLQARREDVTR